MYTQSIQQAIQQSVSKKQEDEIHNSSASCEDPSALIHGRQLSSNHPTPIPKVILRIGCRKLANRSLFSKPEPVVIVSLQRKCKTSTRYEEIGRTEVAKGSVNPDFDTTILVPYFKGEMQKLMFEVYDVESRSEEPREQDLIGRTICSLQSLVGEGSNKCEKALETKSGVEGEGSIIIAAKELK